MREKIFIIVVILTSVILQAPGASAENCFKKTRIITLGASKIVVRGNSVVGAQVDRVVRDIAWIGSRFDQRKGPHQVITEKNELVPYMEGRLIGELMDYARVKVVGLSPAIAKKKGGEYFAQGDDGRYSLRIDPSKTEYLTVRHLDGESIEMVDTHGFNMLVALALKNGGSSKFSLIVACMDIPSKAQAALQLAEAGIDCFGPCDRFASDLIGYKKSHKKIATILGTAPIRKLGNEAVIGDQKVSILENEPIVVQTTDKLYPDQYCDTASRYFKKLKSLYGLDLRLIEVTAAVGETEKLVAAAKLNNATIIGARVYNEDDAKPLKEWLASDSKHRLILFHSAPYEAGYAMFFKFPAQTSFGDLDPIVSD